MTFGDIINSLRDGQCARRPSWRDYVARVDDKDSSGVSVGTYALHWVRKGETVTVFDMEDERQKSAYAARLEEQTPDPSEPVECRDDGSAADERRDDATRATVKTDGKPASKGSGKVIAFTKELMLSLVGDDWRIENTADVQAQQASSEGNF